MIAVSIRSVSFGQNLDLSCCRLVGNCCLRPYGAGMLLNAFTLGWLAAVVSLSGCVRAGYDTVHDEAGVPASESGADSSSPPADVASGLDLALADGSAPDTSALDGAAAASDIVFEAEDGVLVAPFTVVDDPSALGGRAVIDGGPDTGSTTTGSATYTFSVVSAGTFHLFARVQGADSDIDSFRAAFDNGAPIDFFTARGGPYVGWQWREITDDLAGDFVPHTFDLSAGAHVLTVSSRESQSVFDALLITTNPSPTFP